MKPSQQSHVFWKFRMFLQKVYGDYNGFYNLLVDIINVFIKFRKKAEQNCGDWRNIYVAYKGNYNVIVDFIGNYYKNHEQLCVFSAMAKLAKNFIT